MKKTLEKAKLEADFKTKITKLIYVVDESLNVHLSKLFKGKTIYEGKVTEPKKEVISEIEKPIKRGKKNIEAAEVISEQTDL